MQELAQNEDRTGSGVGIGAIYRHAWRYPLSGGLEERALFRVAVPLHSA